MNNNKTDLDEYNFVIDPKTKEKLSVHSQKGGAILSSYVERYKIYKNTMDEIIKYNKTDNNTNKTNNKTNDIMKDN